MYKINFFFDSELRVGNFVIILFFDIYSIQLNKHISEQPIFVGQWPIGIT